VNFLSLFSGIEAASVAWNPLGWKAVAFAETDRFASAVLEHRHPGVPNLGDVTRVQWGKLHADVVVGGSPCQSFSVAGLRGGRWAPLQGDRELDGRTGHALDREADRGCLEDHRTGGRGMSVRAMSWAWDVDPEELLALARAGREAAGGKPPARGVSATTLKLVLLALADHADDTGKCWPGLSRVAAKTGLDRSSVIRAVKVLEAAVVLSVERRLDDAGDAETNLYRLAVPGGCRGQPPAPRGSAGGGGQRQPPSGPEQLPVVAASTWGSGPRQPGVVAHGNPNHQRNRQEPSVEQEEPPQPPAPDGAGGDGVSLATSRSVEQLEAAGKPEPAESGRKAGGKRAKVRSLVELPDWVPADAWEGWLAERASRGKAASENAQRLNLAKLRELRELGHDPRAVLEQSTAAGWMGLFPLRGEFARPASVGPGPGKIDERAEAILRGAGLARPPRPGPVRDVTPDPHEGRRPAGGAR
jgi:hypothetical protein